MHIILKEKEHLTGNVWAFRFNWSEPANWIAGQFIRVELNHPDPDNEGVRRWFTISSAPFEGIAQITTHISSSTFKQALIKLKPGDKLKITEEPSGNFVWQDSKLPIVFVAGGIGITPFRSMLRQRKHDGLPLNVLLVYGNRNNEIVFKKELDEYVLSNSEFKVEYVVGRHLTVQKCEELAPELNKSLVYISGPEPMVEALGDGLRDKGYHDSNIKQDFFPNYDYSNY